MKTRILFILSLSILAALLSGCLEKESIKDSINLSLNPTDVHDRVWTPENGFPHASSNSEYPGDGSDPAFLALNAIDGSTQNQGHGVKFPSWGPEKRNDLFWEVDFGQTIFVDKIIIFIRADFLPYTVNDHDGYWEQATILFSDHSSETIQLKRTAEAQVFHFSSRKTSSVVITDLIMDESGKWCGFTEVEVWGKRI